MKRYLISGAVLLFGIFGGVNFYLHQGVLGLGVALGLLIIAIGFWVIVTRRQVTSLFFPALFIIGAMLLSSLANLDIVDFSLSRVWLYTVALCLMLISHAYLSQADLFEGLYLAGWGWPFLWLTLALFGWLDNQNVLAVWPMLFLSIGLFRPGRWGLNLLYLLPHLLMLSWFNSRGAWLGLAVVMLLALWPYLRGSWPAYVAVAMVGLGLMVAYKPNTALYRFGYWFDALTAFADSPIFGLGPGGLKAGSIISQPGDSGGYQIHAHNSFISWLAQTGLIGLAALLLAVRHVRAMTLAVAPWQRGLLAGWLAWSMVDEPLFWPGPLLVFGLVLGTVKEKAIAENIPLQPVENEFDEYLDDDDFEFFEYEIDEWEQALIDCSYDPDSGFCLMAGTEYCDWDCPLSPIWEAEALEQNEIH